MGLFSLFQEAIDRHKKKLKELKKITEKKDDWSLLISSRPCFPIVSTDVLNTRRFLIYLFVCMFASQSVCLSLGEQILVASLSWRANFGTGFVFRSLSISHSHFLTLRTSLGTESDSSYLCLALSSRTNLSTNLVPVSLFLSVSFFWWANLGAVLPCWVWSATFCLARLLQERFLVKKCLLFTDRIVSLKFMEISH